MAGIVRLDKVKAVYNGHIESVVHTATMENGMVVKDGGLKAGEREIRNVAVPTAGAGDLLLVAHPEIVYSEYKTTDNALENFSIEIGKAARAYHIEKGDIFSVSLDMITAIGAEPVVGNLVVADAGLKLKEVTALSATPEKFHAKIEAIETLGTLTYVGGNGQVGRINKLVVLKVIAN